MEAAPEGIDVQRGRPRDGRVAGVREVHDLHVWTVTSGFPALAAHVRADPARGRRRGRAAVETLLQRRFEIEHTTLQVMPQRLL